jgi:Spy/CpxP family protein refolding chaperone
MLALAGAAGLAAAQAQPLRGPREKPPMDLELRRELFPPELVMRHQEEIDLSEEQKDRLVREMQALQSDLVPLQFEMSEAAGKLRTALAAPRVDEQQAGDLADRLMSLESRIKRRHLALMIRIKNLLTPEQQDRLRDLREDAAERRGKPERRRGSRLGGRVPEEEAAGPGDD